MPKLTIDDISLKGKRALVRVDFNVPQDDSGKITDDLRIRESLPTIRKIISSGGKAILMSHMGRPKGKRTPEFSMAPVALRLSEYLKKEIKLAPDCIGEETKKMAFDLKEGEVLLLENLRFHSDEEKNDPGFAKQLAELGEVYVNDAFGTAHRAHASTEGVTKFISPCVAGYLMRKEIEFLGKAIENPTRPFVAVLGGAKVAGKIEIIETILNKVDTVIVGGGMAFTFLKAEGKAVGGSLLEADKLDLALETLKKARSAGVEILLPVDAVVAKEVAPTAEAKSVSIDQIGAEWKGLDIGPKSTEIFTKEIKSAKTVLWNGPMGVFEMTPFEAGTKTVAHALADATAKGAISIVGGGDSAAAIAKYELSDKISHVSTGGGASLEFLGGLVLPGIAALTDRI
jgi:phosphoglycerate kinase